MFDQVACRVCAPGSAHPVWLSHHQCYDWSVGQFAVWCLLWLLRKVVPWHLVTVRSPAVVGPWRVPLRWGWGQEVGWSVFGVVTKPGPGRGGALLCGQHHGRSSPIGNSGTATTVPTPPQGSAAPLEWPFLPHRLAGQRPSGRAPSPEDRLRPFQKACWARPSIPHLWVPREGAGVPGVSCGLG